MRMAVIRVAIAALKDSSSGSAAVTGEGGGAFF